MKKQVQVLITFAIAILLVTGLYIFTDWFSKVTGYLAGEDEKTKLAQCLQGQNAEFYSDIYCPPCAKQKQILGRSIKLIRIIECGQEMEKCPNIKEVPAWYINKTIHYGYFNLTELDKLSGCNVIE
jgi:hypothetical protein